MRTEVAGFSPPWWVLWFLPCAALATEEITTAEGIISALLIFLGVQFVSLVGHGAASLPDWAQWSDQDGTRVEVAARRLKIIQGLLISILAGNISFYGGQYYAGLHEIPGLIGSGMAAYGGDRFLTPILSRITGRSPPSP